MGCKPLRLQRPFCFLDPAAYAHFCALASSSPADRTTEVQIRLEGAWTREDACVWTWKLTISKNASQVRPFPFPSSIYWYSQAESNSVAQLVLDGLAARFDLKLRYESRVLAYHAETRTSVPTQPASPNLKLTFAKTSVSCFFSLNFNPYPTAHRPPYERVGTCSEKDIRRKASQHSNLSSAQPPYDSFARLDRPKAVHGFPAVRRFSSWTQRRKVRHKRTGDLGFLSNTAGDWVPT